MRARQVSPDTILDESSRALQTSLQALSRWITALSSSSAPNLASIGQTADTIGKVTAALAQVRQVQWCESRAKIPCKFSLYPYLSNLTHNPE
jgi:hypothetical protein